MKHNSPGCATVDCCVTCVQCDALFALNWLAGLCTNYTNLGAPLSGAQDAANAAYFSGISTTFGNMSLSWTSTTLPHGFVTYNVRYASAVDYTTYTIYSCNPGRTTVYSVTVQATIINIGAWWDPSQPCHPQWFWNLTHWVTINGINFFGINLLCRQTTSMSTAPGDDISPSGFPFSAVLMYPSSTRSNGWSSEITQALALSANCDNPISSAIQAEFHTRYGPTDTYWPNGGGTVQVLPPLADGVLNISNAVGIPFALPVC